MSALSFSGLTDSGVVRSRIRGVSLGRGKALFAIRKETRRVGKRERWGERERERGSVRMRKGEKKREEKRERKRQTCREGQNRSSFQQTPRRLDIERGEGVDGVDSDEKKKHQAQSWHPTAITATTAYIIFRATSCISLMVRG
jgi:hypothetical protein